MRLIGESPAIDALRSIPPGGRHRFGRVDPGRKRHRQGGRGPVDPLSQPAARPAVYRVNSAPFPRRWPKASVGHEKGAFTDAREARAGLRTGRRGDTAPRRDRRFEPGVPGQDAPGAGREGSSAHGRVHADPHRRPAAGRHESKFGRNGAREKISRGFVFSPQRGHARTASAACRGDDVLLMAEHFLTDFCQRARRKVPRLTAAASRKRLIEHAWPGNVRELRNLMEPGIPFRGRQHQRQRTLWHLSFRHADRSQFAPNYNLPLAKATNQFQIEYIHRLIEQSRGNVGQAATRLGVASLESLSQDAATGHGSRRLALCH